MTTFYVTTPIYYVNDKPHIGHSYTTIAADVLSRFWRMAGRDVRFLTGTDEHGIKIVKAAAEKGMTPRQLADEVVVHFQELWRDLNITNDDFIRTSEPRHEKRVQELVRRLVEKGQIYQGSYEGWYDEGQEEFVTESTARENDGKSPINGKPLVRYSEKTWFFRLKDWIEPLKKYIDEHPDFIQPQARRNEVRSKLDLGVEDLSISREREKLGGWGIAMPNDPTHSVYVWIDALSNYYTALGAPAIGDEFDNKFVRYWPAAVGDDKEVVHLIGKDILWFHAVYWPCMLMALDIPLPSTIYAHGWWTSEGKKMSKTLGNFVSRETIAEICRDYSVDYYRYFLLRAVAFGTDGDFSREMLMQRYNAELANGLGNLLSRTVNMIDKYFAAAVPPIGPADPVDAPVLAAADELVQAAPRAMERLEFHAYLDRITALVDAANRYIEVTAPFKLAKDPAQRERLGTILYNCAEAVRLALVYLTPIMPQVAPRGLAQLGFSIAPGQTFEQVGRWGVLPPGTKTAKAEGLFPRKEQGDRT
jgi:methionyl-tRNA synthetase